MNPCGNGSVPQRGSVWVGRRLANATEVVQRLDIVATHTLPRRGTDPFHQRTKIGLRLSRDAFVVRGLKGDLLIEANMGAGKKR